MNPDDPGLRALRIERLLRILMASDEPMQIVMRPEPMLLPICATPYSSPEIGIEP